LGILHIPFFSNRPYYDPFIALLRPFVSGEDRVQGEAVLLDDIKDFSGNTGLSFFTALKAKSTTSEKGREGQTW
jgi:hypothetical protein